jgi:predicted dehydrogenase
MKDRAKLVLVGMGGYGETFLQPMLNGDITNVDLAACVDPVPENSEYYAGIQELGIPVYDSLASCFGNHKGIDLTVICSPLQYHAPQTIEALEYGSHVLCEKPLAPTVQEAQEMMQVRDRTGKSVSIGYQWSFSPAIQNLKKDILSGVYGQPKILKTIVFRPRGGKYFTRNTWAGALQTAGGDWVLDSPVNNANAHFLHNMFFVLGRTQETSALPVSVNGELYRANNITNFDTAAMRVKTDCGIEIFFYASHAVEYSQGPDFEYQFENGIITSEYRSDGLNIFSIMNDGSRIEYGVPNVSSAYKLNCCVEALLKGNSPAFCSLEAAYSHTLCLNGLQDSMPYVSKFPDDIIIHKTNPDDGDIFVSVDGLGNILLYCYDNCIMPDEIGSNRRPHWVETGNEINLKKYKSFPSLFHAEVNEHVITNCTSING